MEDIIDRREIRDLIHDTSWLLLYGRRKVEILDAAELIKKAKPRTG